MTASLDPRHGLRTLRHTLATARDHLVKRAPHRRVMLKWLHWTLVPLLIWFVLVTPDDVMRIGMWAFRVHSVLGLVFVLLTLYWTADTLRRGLAGRPGPKLKGVARWVHPWLHRSLLLLMFGVAMTGFLIGLTSHVLLWAGGIVPIAPPLSMPSANRWWGEVHVYEFYVLTGVVIAHAGFHTWRHLWLKDNVLRIMAPKRFHRFL
ncbi:MAG: cytochrome b/b6 domain-containing protein [Pseudomonadota bacterium]